MKYILVFAYILGCLALEPLNVMLMTYRRTENLSQLLGQIADILHKDGGQTWDGAHITVSQSCEAADSDYVLKAQEIVRQFSQSFRTILHVCTPFIQQDTSFTVSKKHGSKRNSMNNLLHGLDMAMFGRHAAVRLSEGTGSTAADQQKDVYLIDDGVYPIITIIGGDRPNATHAVVLEDDIEVSADSLQYFAYCLVRIKDATATHSDTISRFEGSKAAIDRPITHIKKDDDVQLCTALSFQRPDILMGQRDVTFSHSWIYSALHGLNDKQPGEIVERMTMNQRTVFKTLAWMVSASGYSQLMPALRKAVAFTPSVGNNAQLPSQQDGENSGEMVVYRTSQMEMQGCVWCNDYCYDHVIEWTFQGQPFLSPRIPRVSQTAGSGMTSTTNDINDIYRGAIIGVEQFVESTSLASIMAWFPNPGVSARSIPPNHGSIAIKCEIIAAYITEPVLMYPLVAVIVLIASAVAARKLRSRCCRKAGQPIIPMSLHTSASHLHPSLAKKIQASKRD